MQEVAGRCCSVALELVQVCEEILLENLVF